MRILNLLPSKRKTILYGIVIIIAVILLLGFLIHLRNQKKFGGKCENLGSLKKTVGDTTYTYKVYERGACYQESCVRYDDPEETFCRLRTVLLGFRKMEGADPNTFIIIPAGYSTAIDKNGIYVEGKKVLNMNIFYLTHYVGSLLGYCNRYAQESDQGDFYYGNPENMHAFCDQLRNKFNESQQETNQP